MSPRRHTGPRTLPMLQLHQEWIYQDPRRKWTTLRREFWQPGIYRMQDSKGYSIGCGEILASPFPMALWHCISMAQADHAGHVLTYDEYESLLESEGYPHSAAAFEHLINLWHPGWLRGDYPLILHAISPAIEIDPATHTPAHLFE